MTKTGWPTVYDNNYLPRANQKYWFPKIETMPRKERAKIILKKLKAQITYAYHRSSFYRAKWKAAGFHPSDFHGLDDLRRVPFVTKADIQDDQAAHPPFGSYLCIPKGRVYAYFGTSGTTGKPTAFGISSGDWDRISNMHARVMWSFGVRPTDTVMISAVFSLYVGGWGALAGTQRLGSAVFPFGAGAPGQTRLAVRWIQELKPSVFYSTPSYALHLAEIARDEGANPAKDFCFRIMFFSGEPGAGVPAIKRKIEETFNCACVDTGSTAEMTPWMTNAECEHRSGMHLWEDVVYPEVVDQKTGETVDFGEKGVIAYTHLERESQPMIRFLSGDLTQWSDEPCECGRTYLRLPKGIYGRIDDMLIIRGENVYPSAIQAALESTEGYGGEHRIIITKEKEMDVLTVHAEYDSNIVRRVAKTLEVLNRLRVMMEDNVKKICGVRATIKLHPPFTFERSQFKARRITDQRSLYAQLANLRKE